MTFITCNLTLTISFLCVLILSWKNNLSECTTLWHHQEACDVFSLPNTPHIYMEFLCHSHASKDSSSCQSLYMVLTYMQIPSETTFPSLNIFLVIFKIRKLVSHKVVFTYPFLRKWPVGIRNSYKTHVNILCLESIEGNWSN